MCMLLQHHCLRPGLTVGMWQRVRCSGHVELQVAPYLDDEPIPKASRLMEADLRVQRRTGVCREVWLPSSHSPQVLPQPPQQGILQVLWPPESRGVSHGEALLQGLDFQPHKCEQVHSDLRSMPAGGVWQMRRLVAALPSGSMHNVAILISRCMEQQCACMHGICPMGCCKGGKLLWLRTWVDME